MDLKILCQEIDYQKTYPYDKRVDFFNKYNIPTTQVAFNPILELAQFAYGSSFQLGGRPHGYSHSGATFSSFNNSLKDPKKGKILLSNSYIWIFENRIKVFRYIPGSYNEPVEKRYKPFITFDSKTKEVSLIGTDGISGTRVRKTLYQDIDEFLIDFGYEAW